MATAFGSRQPGTPDFADAFFPRPTGSELRAIVDTGVLELSGRHGIMAVPLPIVDSPVTLTVADAATAPQLLTIPTPAAGIAGTPRQGSLSGQP